MTSTKQAETAPFRPALVRKLLQPSAASTVNAPSMVVIAAERTDLDSNNINDDTTASVKKRLTPEAVLLAGELLRLFVVEARQRALIEAECEMESSVTVNTTITTTVIEPHHITRIAAELLMDFS